MRSTYTAGRHLVPIHYVDPTTGQAIDRDIVINNDDRVPAAGDEIVVAVQPSNPDRLVVPGDGDPLADILLLPIAIVVVVVAAGMIRLLAVRRTERLVSSGATSFVMLATLRRSRWRPNGVCCSLYPIDAAAGALPLCTFDVLTSGGLPVDAPAIPVEVRGRPVPGGALVVRSGECVVRPLRRPARRGSAAFDGSTTEVPSVLAPAPAPGPMWAGAPSLIRCVGWRGLAAVAMTVVSMVSIPVWVLGVRRDDRLASTGTPVLAEVVGVNDTDLTVRYTPPGAAAPVEASTHGSTDRVIGRRYPAHADSSGRLRLDADPYNWVGPGIWVLAGWGLVAMLVWPRLRWWRDARRFAANGPWYAAASWHGPGGDCVGPPDIVGAFMVRGTADPSFTHGPVPCSVAGSLEPGDAFAVTGPSAVHGPVGLSQTLTR